MYAYIFIFIYIYIHILIYILIYFHSCIWISLQFLTFVLKSRFGCPVIRTGLQRRKSILIILLVVFYIDKNKKKDRQDKSPVNTFPPSILSYGNAIWFSMSEYFPIKGCSLHLYDCVIKCHNTRGDMSAMSSMSRHSKDNMHGTSSTFKHIILWMSGHWRHCWHVTPCIVTLYDTIVQM